MPNPEISSQQRVITAAVALFSQMGYNGASTRDIAKQAEVNEASIYRHFATKRDLFVAALEAELGKLQLRPDLICQLGAAADRTAALTALFQMISDAVLRQPALIRLLHFSVLEFGPDLNEIYGRYLHGMLDIAGNCLERWADLEQWRHLNARIAVLSFTATVVALQDFYPVLSGEQLPFETVESAAAGCAELWHAALSAPPATTTT